MKKLNCAFGLIFILIINTVNSYSIPHSGSTSTAVSSQPIDLLSNIQSKLPEIENLINETYFKESLCLSLGLSNKTACELYHQEKQSDLKELLAGNSPIKREKRQNNTQYYKLTYTSPYNDPFYKALILFLLNLRSTTTSASATDDPSYDLLNEDSGSRGGGGSSSGGDSSSGY